MLTLAAIAGVAACGGATGANTDTMDREVFVQTYVDLRVSALETDSQRLATPAREAILAEHGVTAEELKGFADAHAADLDFMREVWNEIELRMDQPPADSR
jgi:hypothetical protein